ncbi:hypothetical protein WA158_004775 [Blastocystis sp. Blastoise]
MNEKVPTLDLKLSDLNIQSIKTLPIHELVRLQKLIQNEISTRLNSTTIESPIPEEEVVDTPKAEKVEDNVYKQIIPNTLILTSKIKATATRFIKMCDNWPVDSWIQYAHKDIIWDNNICKWNISMNGIHFGTCSADGTAKLWNYSTENHEIEHICTYTGHTGSVNSIEFHPSQLLTATASGDGTVQIWKPLFKEPSTTSDTHNNSLFFSSSKSRRLSDDPALVVNEALVTLPSTNTVCTYAVWNSTGNRLVTASQEIIKLWDLSRCEAPLQILTGHDKTINHIAVHPTHPSLFITSSNDGTIRLWDMRSATFIVNVFHGHQKLVSSSYFLPSKNAIVSGSDDCSLKIWDLCSFQNSKTIYTSYNTNRFSVSPSENSFCVPSNKGTAAVYNMMGETIGLLSTDVYNQRKMILKCNWSNDLIFTCGIDRSIAIWKQPS